MPESASKKLSLCMIVRDEEQLLPGCLESVRGVVDEIVAVDTGSSDATPEIVRAHHGLLLQRAWRDDFSAARNVSLDAATGDWILWMDADERLRPEEHGRLRRLIERNTSEDAFSVPIRSETPTGAQVTRAHRLFRNRKGIRFSGRVHEQVSPSFARIRARVGPSADFTIDHLGYNFSADKLRGKAERNLRLLNAAKRQDPRDAYVRFCLGQAQLLLGNAADAEKEIRAALGETASEPISKRLPDDIRAAAFNNLAQCALGRGAPEEALQRCAESLGICPETGYSSRDGVLRTPGTPPSRAGPAGTGRGGPTARSPCGRRLGDRSDNGSRGVVERDGAKPVAARSAGAGAAELPAGAGRPQGQVRGNSGRARAMRHRREHAGRGASPGERSLRTRARG